MKRDAGTVALYTLLHFLVDFSCVYLVISVLLGAGSPVQNRGGIIILYNLAAFAGQLPLGVVADRLGRNSLFSACGCLLIVAAYPLAGLPYAACLLAGIGNAAFHLGGGIDVLRIGAPKAALPGVFVSSGALGVWLAYRTTGRVASAVPLAAMLIAAASLIYLDRFRPAAAVQRPYEKPTFPVALAVVLLLGAVAMRSYLGMIMNFSWKSGTGLSFAFIAAVVLGKALGGVLGDRLGWLRLTVSSLLVSAALFGFGFGIPAAVIAAVFLFNMTMPVTLTAVSELSGGKYGFAFGLTTFALFAGFVPVVEGWTVFSPLGLAGGSLVSAALISAGLAVYRTVMVKKHGAA